MCADRNLDVLEQGLGKASYAIAMEISILNPDALLPASGVAYTESFSDNALPAKAYARAHRPVIQRIRTSSLGLWGSGKASWGQIATARMLF